MFVTRTMLQFPPAESKTQKVHEPCGFSAKTFLWGWWQWSVTIWALGSPQNSYIEVLVPKVMAFGGGACRKWLSLDEVMRVEPHDRISALKRRERERAALCLFVIFLFSFSLSLSHVNTQGESGHLQVRKTVFTRNHSCWTLIWDFQPQGWETDVCIVGAPQSIVLWNNICLSIVPVHSILF